jgi:heptosyltransferase-1
MSPQPLRERDFGHILIIKPSSPGDILHSLPVLHALRGRFPNARIAWLVATPFVDLLSTHPAIDELIPFDRKRYGFLGRSLRITWEFVRFIGELRSRRFDLAIDLQGLFRSGFLALASGAPVRVGPADVRELAGLFYTHRAEPIDADAHAVDKNMAVAAVLGVAEGPLDFTPHLSDDDRRAAESLLREAGVEPAGRFAVLVPGTRWETKRWPARRFGELARRLRAEHGLSVVLVGGGGDLAAGADAVAASDGAARNLCGRTTLRQAAAIIERAALVVTADSTPMHLAAALNRPLVALFGPTNPARTGPYGRLADVVRLDLPCSPCYYRKLSHCPYGQACMWDLDIQRVAEAVSLSLR